MLKRVIISCIFLLIFSQKSVLAEQLQTDFIKQNISNIMKDNDIPGVAVELFVDGKASNYYAGFANRELKKPVTSNTIFELGSLTKLMTSLLFAQEIDSAKMQLDDPVTNYLHGISNSFDDVTLKNLATHTGGLPLTLPATVTNQKQIFPFLKNYELPYSPDEEWVYSNVSIGLLGEALEVETHHSFQQLYQTHILGPLHMQPIGLIVPKKLQANLAVGYSKTGQSLKASQLGVFPSASNMKASAHDMQYFLSAAIGLTGTPEQIIYPMRMTQAGYVKLPEEMQGLGWQIHELNSATAADLLNVSPNFNFGPTKVVEIFDKPIFDGNALIDKTGTTDGFRAYIAVIPNKKAGIVILMNRNVPNSVIVATARKILFNAIGLQVNHEQAATTES